MNNPNIELGGLAAELNAAATRAMEAANLLNDATRRFDASRAELRALLRELRGDSEILLLKPN